MQPNDDVSKMKLPLPLVAVVVGGVLSTVGGMWASTAGIRSDMRDIKTRMEMQAEVDRSRNDNLRESVESMKRRQELQQMEIQGMKEIVMRLEGMKR